MAKRTQPYWLPPPAPERPKLQLFNSLTRQKEDFIPLDGNNVRWYSCGPTVYDASHMGHARSYISFDIMRRILADYFGYNVFYVMNITDVDDKIIKRARQNYLYKKYVTASTNTSLDKLLANQKEVLELFNAICKGTSNSDKKDMLERMLIRMHDSMDALIMAVASSDPQKINEARALYLAEAKDPISEWLDLREGSTVKDNSLFESLPRYWEDEYHKDMQALNILPPDVLTRVSEYVPQIIAFIERILANGFAYHANCSVYFDVNAFDKCEKHHYAKLVPEAFGDTKSLQEGEGDLSISEDRLSEKRSPTDFALWKASKAGEPSWQSPWGRGRPGWHIECSAMASDIFGSMFDIHTGGVDLKFPHHDNELAQSEAAFNQSEWVKYFLHTGHLTIAGCKMSKSLKNFITIQEALKLNTSCQLRLAFLLHSWKDTLDYSSNTMEMACQYERFLNEFFLNVKDLTRHVQTESPCAQFSAWTSAESALQEKFKVTRDAVHMALCDNIDTRSALESIRELVSISNVYIRDNKCHANCILLRRIASYITDILHVFGVIQGPRGGIGFPVGDGNANVDIETTLMPYVDAVADFRNNVREEAKAISANNILQLCDKLRDEVLPSLGVRLEDKENGKYAVKFIDREVLLKDREAKRKAEAERLGEKQRKQEAAAKLLATKEAQKRINPQAMFLGETDKYSQFDDNGLPTHDAEGKELSKGLLKKLTKLQQQQQSRYKEYLATKTLDNQKC